MSLLKLCLPFAFICCVIAAITNRPSNLPCNINDSECLIDMAQWVYDKNIAGVPELGVVTLDPMKHDKVVGDLGFLRYNLSESYLAGMRNCKVKVARMSTNYTSTRLEFNCPQTTLTGYYSVEGNLLNYPIKGNGKYTVVANDFYNIFDLGLSYYKVGNEIHHLHSTYMHKAELRGTLNIDLKNGDGTTKKLSQTAKNVLRVANENAKLFTNLMDSPVHSANMKKVLRNMNKLLRSIPTLDLFQIDESKVKIENV